MLVLVLLSSFPSSMVHEHFSTIEGPQITTRRETNHTSEYKWPAGSFASPAHKKALSESLDKQRNTDYAHLSEGRFKKLKKLLMNYSTEIALALGADNSPRLRV